MSSDSKHDGAMGAAVSAAPAPRLRPEVRNLDRTLAPARAAALLASSTIMSAVSVPLLAAAL